MLERFRRLVASRNLAVFVLFCLLTAAFTFPAVLELRTTMFGWISENIYDASFLWLFHYGLVSPHASPFTSYTVGPVQFSLSITQTMPLFGLFTFPLHYVLDLLTIYNLLMLSNYILTGFGMYLLVSYLARDRIAAFFAGMIYAFSPEHINYSLHLPAVSSTQFIPFYVLYLIRYSREGERKFFCLSCLFAAFIAYISLQLFLFVGVFSAIYVLFHVRSLLAGGRLVALFLLAATVGLLSLPVCLPVIVHRDFLKEDLAYLIRYSADLGSFITPYFLNAFYGKYFWSAYENFTGGHLEIVHFPGYFVILLALFGCLLCFRKITFWLVAAGIFFILALGPRLTIFGIIVPDIPLPYTLFQKIPPLSILRVPGRLSIMFNFSLAVIAGLVINHLREKIAGPYRRGLVHLFICALWVIEFTIFPFPNFDPKIPKVYSQKLLGPGDYGMLEIPHYARGEYLFYQSIHKRPIVYARAGRRSLAEDRHAFIAFRESLPLYARLLYFNDSDLTVAVTPEAVEESRRQYFRKYKAKYVVLYKEFLSRRRLAQLRKYLDKGFERPFFEDELNVVYKTYGE
jgi:hypothetical protein